MAAARVQEQEVRFCGRAPFDAFYDSIGRMRARARARESPREPYIGIR